MYKAYERKNDDPILRSFMYMFVLYLSIFVSFWIHFEKAIEMSHIISSSDINRIKHSYLFWIIIFGGIISLIYFSYFKKGIGYYDQLFMNSKWDQRIKIWMLVILPFLILFLGIIFF